MENYGLIIGNWGRTRELWPWHPGESMLNLNESTKNDLGKLANQHARAH